MWSYNSPVRVLFGNDGFASIAPLIDGRPYALVTYADAPFRALADQVTKEAGKPLIVVNDIAPNPDCKLLSEQSARFASLPSEPEVIVALGGARLSILPKSLPQRLAISARYCTISKLALADQHFLPFRLSRCPQRPVLAAKLPLGQQFGMRSVGANSPLCAKPCIPKSPLLIPC